MVFGVIVWNKLPEKMAIHWGITGEADNFAGKAVSVFLMPLIPLAAHWLCVLVTALSRRAMEQSSKIIGIVLFICPVLSIVVNCAMYLDAFDIAVDISLLILIFLGFIFTLIGNYMPKCIQNKYIGIRVKWTLEDEDNWRATHRLSSKLWAVGGIALIAVAFLPDLIAFISCLCILVLVTVIPIIYSYRFSKKKKKS